MADEAPTIRIIDFYTTFDQLVPKRGDILNDNVDDKGYRLDAAGKRILEREATDWVVYAPAHSPVNTRNIERVKFLKPLENGDPDSAGYRLQTARWKQIEPAYDAWKKGQDIPLDGTPLAVWAGIRPEQIKVLQQFGIRTIEEVQRLSESQIERIRLPNMRELKLQAKAFLDNMGASIAAEQQAKMQETIEAMSLRMEEMEEALRRAHSEADARRETPSSDDEAAALRAQLDERNIEYDGRWAAPKLREKLQSVMNEAA